MNGELESFPSAGGGIFPFLSVLSCTIGAMILILVAGSLKAAVKDPDLPKKFARANERYETAKGGVDALLQAKALDEQVGKLRAELAGLARQEAADERAAKEKQVLLARVQQETAGTRAIPTKVVALREGREMKLARDRARRDRDSSSEALGALEKRAEKLDADLRSLRARRDKLTKLAGSPEVRFKVSAEGADRTPVYVDLAEDSILLHTSLGTISAGVRIPAGEGEILEKLASEFAKPDSTRYAVFLVRPGAVELFRKAAATFRKWRAPFGHEPVERSWRIKLGKAER